MFYFGAGNVPQNLAKAFHWFTKGTVKDNAGAQYNSGLMYANGQGVHRDNAMAYAVSSLAALQGNSIKKHPDNPAATVGVAIGSLAGTKMPPSKIALLIDPYFLKTDPWHCCKSTFRM